MKTSKPEYFEAALNFVKNIEGTEANIEYMADYEDHEVYQIINAASPQEGLVDDFILAGPDGVYKAYYHEAVAIARTLNI